MECDIPVIARRFLHTFWLVCGLLAVASHGVFAAERSLDLVSSEQATVPALTEQEVRKLLLGEALIKNDQRVQALRNRTNPFLYEVFLQKTVFMSTHNYDRQLLSRVFRLGGQRPPAYENLNELITALKSNPAAVTFMWEDEAKTIPDIKVSTRLWQGPIE
jgi:hypothetical protein